MTSILSRRSRLIGLMVSTLLSAQLQAAQTVELDIPSQPLSEALRQLGTASNTNIIFEPGMVTGAIAPAVKGNITAQEALARLLAGTRWSFKFVDENTVSLVPADPKSADTVSSGGVDGFRLPSSVTGSVVGRYAQAADAGVMQEKNGTKDEQSRGRGSSSQVSAEELDTKGIPEVLVKGSRSLNVDIERTEDDPQPYVVLDREQIERSGATTLDQFLQQRLPMNTAVGNVGSAFKGNGDTPTTGGISLRGLGPDQTLILVDGHRMSSSFAAGSLIQASIDAIPLAAIERIEILPSTASGIYGGSATGGVINIITRKDYSGGEFRLTYDNTFSTDSSVRKVDALFGHNFNEGKTNILLGVNYSDANELKLGDRDFAKRGRERISNNNPDRFSQPWKELAPLFRTRV